MITLFGIDDRISIMLYILNITFGKQKYVQWWSVDMDNQFIEDA